MLPNEKVLREVAGETGLREQGVVCAERGDFSSSYAAAEELGP